MYMYSDNNRHINIFILVLAHIHILIQVRKKGGNWAGDQGTRPMKLPRSQSEGLQRGKVILKGGHQISPNRRLRIEVALPKLDH
jgi:hypothetical protein